MLMLVFSAHWSCLLASGFQVIYLKALTFVFRFCALGSVSG